MLEVFFLYLKSYAHFEKVKIAFNNADEARKYTRYSITKGCAILPYTSILHIYKKMISILIANINKIDNKLFERLLK
ncbi:TPA: hypothetical protein P0Q79_000998 [Staphylococcus aureus]|nr:hypothetical protein PCL91_03515 [Staphylococcus aureus]HDC4077850.1 hypothetical protein [Staphylococcus aureus]HDM8864516.1 hypothetical protein [Staphylococcus aureus]